MRLPFARIAIALVGTLLTFEQLCVAQLPEDAADRHRRVAQRRAGIHIICHRGATEFAHENTLEAYRAAFELGADGNEIDIRATKDGVLVCFHDDMLDHLLVGYGDVSDYLWADLQKLAFRSPGAFGEYCRIPTLREVLELHRDHAGLLHLDVKRPGLGPAVGALLDELDMWDHVVQAPAEFTDERIVRTAGKASMYLDRSEVDPAAIAEVLQRPGKLIMVEDPRAVAHALGRTILRLSAEPVQQQVALWAELATSSAADTGQLEQAEVQELLEVLRAADGWNLVAEGNPAERHSAERILRRARAADHLARHNAGSAEVFRVLEQRVRERSLHRDWRYCGLDGAAALRALVSLDAPQAVDVARFCLWRDDPAVEAARNPQFDNPRAWTDWRTKTPVFALLETVPGAATGQLCRDYLALTDQQAHAIGVPVFESAARTLLAISPEESTARELFQHRLSSVRGRALLFCLAHAQERWATRVLEDQAPYALEWIVDRADAQQ